MHLAISQTQQLVLIEQLQDIFSLLGMHLAINS